MADGSVKRGADASLILGGILVFIAGLIIFAMPGISLVTIALIAGIMFLIGGISEFIAYFRLRKTVASVSGWTIVNAICDVILGILFLIHPVVTSEIMFWVLGIYAIVYGVFAIASSFALTRVSGWWVMLLWGIVAVLCGFTFIMNPSTFLLFLAILLVMRGITLVVYGIIGPRHVATL